MSTEVVHVKHGHEGGIRLTLAEPHGGVQAPRRVVGKIPGHTYDHDATFSVEEVPGGPARRAYGRGDPAETVETWLAGQRELILPAGTTTVEFDDGTTFSIPGADQ